MSDIRLQSLQAGLDKALYAELTDMFAYYSHKVELELLHVPEHKREWRKGSFSWSYVQAVECWYNLFLREWETMAMARSKRGGSKQQKQLSFSFVRCELRKEDKERAKTWIQKNEKDFWGMLHSLMGEGHKVSFSLSKEGDTFTCSATGQQDSPNEGLILTARHKDPWQAAATLLFKHHVLFDEGIWSTDDDEDDGWS